MGHFMRIYIRQQKRYILTCLLFCIIFAIMFILYQLPPSAIVYPLLLCAVAGMGIMGVDMALTYRRYTALWQILDAVGLEPDQEYLSGKRFAGDFRTADGDGCAWELLQEMLYSRESDVSEKGDWEACIYREMVRQLLLEQRRPPAAKGGG